MRFMPPFHDVSRENPIKPTSIMTNATGIRVMNRSTIITMPMIPAMVGSILCLSFQEKIDDIHEQADGVDGEAEGKHVDNVVFRQFEVHGDFT